MTFSVRSTFALLAAGSLAFVACGGDDGGSSSGDLSEADLALAAAVSADLANDDEDGFSEVFDVECMGRELVTALGGADAAEEKYGFTVETASEMDDTPMELADAERVVAGYQKCGDFDDLLKKSFTGFGASEDEAQCVIDALPDGLVADSVTIQLTDPTGAISENPIDGALDSAAVECGLS